MNRNIGDSYVVSIGRTYGNFPHASPMQEAIENPFWNRVLEALHDQGVDRDQQMHVARLLKIAQPSVWEWTDGGMPSMKNAIKLAGKLNVCVEWLLTGQEPKRAPPSDPLADELWDLWQKLPALREKIVSFARFEASQLANKSPFTKDEPAQTKQARAKSSRNVRY